MFYKYDISEEIIDNQEVFKFKRREKLKKVNEDVWLSQGQVGILYQKSKSSISEHIKEIFKDGELNEDSVVRKYRTTAANGKAYSTSYYNLDVIISVGYRVKSHRGTPKNQSIWLIGQTN